MSDFDDDPDRAYFYRRAEQELGQAERAENSGAVRAHYVLAGFYLDRVYGADPVEPEATVHAPAG